MTPFTIGMLVFDGMTALDFGGPFDVFARLPDTRVEVLAKDIEPVVTDLGRRELPTCALRDAPALDMAFVGGGPGVLVLWRTTRPPPSCATARRRRGG